MRLPNPPAEWSRDYQQRVNSEIERADEENRKLGRDIDLSRGDGVRVERLILTASDGSRWALVVDTSGNLSTVAA